MAVSRFFCFAILNAFRKNKKWRSRPFWRATHNNTLGGYMRRGESKARLETAGRRRNPGPNLYLILKTPTA